MDQVRSVNGLQNLDAQSARALIRPLENDIPEIVSIIERTAWETPGRAIHAVASNNGVQVARVDLGC